jgi:hypothetical protein
MSRAKPVMRESSVKPLTERSFLNIRAPPSPIRRLRGDSPLMELQVFNPEVPGC